MSRRLLVVRRLGVATTKLLILYYRFETVLWALLRTLFELGREFIGNVQQRS